MNLVYLLLSMMSTELLLQVVQYLGTSLSLPLVPVVKYPGTSLNLPPMLQETQYPETFYSLCLHISL